MGEHMTPISKWWIRPCVTCSLSPLPDQQCSSSRVYSTAPPRWGRPCVQVECCKLKQIATIKNDNVDLIRSGHFAPLVMPVKFFPKFQTRKTFPPVTVMCPMTVLSPNTGVIITEALDGDESQRNRTGSILLREPIMGTAPWVHPSPNPKGISIGLAVFAGLTIVTDRPTDRPRYIGDNRPHLRT